MRIVLNRHFTKAIFAHAWDLEDGNGRLLMDWASAIGLDTLCITASYHSGWLIQPHHPRRRLRWSESGAAYFHPTAALYAETCLLPPVASCATEVDYLRQAADLTSDAGLKLVAWTVGAHNTRLGLAFPHLTQHDAYGDSLPHALSLGHNDTRNFLKSLVRDVAIHYSPYAIQLEGFQWHSVHHNHAHERDLVGLSELEQQLLSLCFNPETMRKAEAAGIDACTARNAVKSTLELAFAYAPIRPPDYPETMEELEARSPELQRYRAFLSQLADSLVAEIYEDSLRHSSCKLYLQSRFTPSLRRFCDGFAIWAYGQSPEQLYDSVSRAIASLPDDWNGEYHCYVRLGMGIPNSPEQLHEMLLAAKSAGATGVYLYNYSEAPPTMLGWLQAALQRL